MEHELPGILDGVDEPVTVEELEDVVRRAGQRRRATLVAGAAALLAVGAFGGAIARGSTDDRRTGLAAGDQAAPAATFPPDIAGSMAMGLPAPGFGEGFTFTSLFRRDSHGIAIRAYRITAPHAPRGTSAPCGYQPDMVNAGLSNTAAVAQAVVPSFRGGDPANRGQLKLAGTGSFGVDEKEPATWAIVEVDGSVSTVRLTAGGVTDSMAPQDGAAVLVVPGATVAGTVEALGADGGVLASRALNQPDSWTPDPACRPEPCHPRPEGPDGATAATTVPGDAPTAREVPTAEPAGPVQDLPCEADQCHRTGPAQPPPAPPAQEPAKVTAATVVAGGPGTSEAAVAVVCAGPVTTFAPPPSTTAANAAP